jgi:hypothetical protein
MDMGCLTMAAFVANTLFLEEYLEAWIVIPALLKDLLDLYFIFYVFPTYTSGEEVEVGGQRRRGLEGGNRGANGGVGGGVGGGRSMQLRQVDEQEVEQAQDPVASRGAGGSLPLLGPYTTLAGQPAAGGGATLPASGRRPRSTPLATPTARAGLTTAPSRLANGGLFVDPVPEPLPEEESIEGVQIWNPETNAAADGSSVRLRTPPEERLA